MMDLGWIYYFAVCLQWIIYPFCQLTQYMVSDLCNVILSFDTATCRISRQRQTLQQIYLCYEDAEISQVQNNQKVE